MVQQEQRSNRQRLDNFLKIGLSLAMVVIGYFLTRDSIGEIALRWMYVFHISEFDSWGTVGDFFWELRTGVSPVWALLDIVSYRLWDNVHLTETWLYRGSLILAYVLPIWLFGQARWQIIGSFVLGVVFLWGTVVIHPGNPQVYDAYMPALVLLLFKLLQRVQEQGLSARIRMGICILMGLLLSVIELTRPFVLMFMPMFLGSIWLMLRGLPRRYFVAFLIPILMLSGGWHAKMVLMHGQWHWTNHTGFNMYQSWYEFVKFREFPEAPPRGPNRGKNINTEQHAQWSSELSREIVASWWQRPGEAIAHVGWRASQFYAPQTELGYAKPQHAIFIPYRILVWAASLALLVGWIALAIQLLRSRGRGILEMLAQPEVLLMLFAAYTIAIFIVVEAKEDARFLISVLPYLACLPGLGRMFKRWKATS